jgi:death-on-curing protein
MKVIKYPSLEEALYLHNILIEKFGGTNQVLDLGLLDSALSRPQSGYYESLSEQAGALMHSLVKNHAFADGNKRIALALTATFLLMNGYQLNASADQSEEFVLALAAGKVNSLIEVVEWLESKMQSVDMKQ